MKPEVKQKWLEALRSGEYAQTENLLRDKEGFCCLGVLCDLHAKETGQTWDFVDKCGGYFTYVEKASETLPRAVVDWAGLTLHDPVVTYTEDDPNYDPDIDEDEDDEGNIIETESANSEALSELNDNGANFKQIADVIEKYL